MSTVKKIPGSISGLASLERPKFSPGLLLEDDDLTLTVDYMRNLTRLLFRSLFGCGVICGLRVSPEVVCGKLKITIAKGVALNCLGDPIELLTPQTFTIDPTCGPPLPRTLCIAIRHHDKCCGPRDVTCSPEDERSGVACTRIREGYQIWIAEQCPDSACGCPKEEQPLPPNPQIDAPVLNDVDLEGGEAEAADAEDAPDRERIDNYGDPCYEDHYDGECACGCCSDWIILANLETAGNGDNLTVQVDHSRRRFVRPVLMRDPIAYEERKQREQQA